MISLRPYQDRDLQSIREAFRLYNRVILTQPTGSGKGTLAAYIVNSAIKKGKRVLFLVYGRPLVHDMSRRVSDWGIEHGVVMGSGKSKVWLPAQVASVSTMSRREKFADFDVIIVDEVQDCNSDQFRKVLEQYPKAKVLGLSATPVGPGGSSLGISQGGMFEYLVVGPTVDELIACKALLPSQHYSFNSIDMGDVKLVAGEFNQAQHSAAVDAAGAQRVGDILKTYQDHGGGFKAAGFAVDQKDARLLCERFNAAGIESTTVFADTPDDARELIWKDYQKGSLRVIWSVAVISRGWDQPICQCVIDASSTMSIVKARQRWGRGSRPYPGQDHFRILDAAGNLFRHGFYETPVEWSLDGKPYKIGDGEKEYKATRCQKCFRGLKPGTKACPYCGFQQAVAARTVEEAKGDLGLMQRDCEAEEAARKEKNKGRDWSALHTEYVRLKAIVQEKNYKSAWLGMTFKARHGFWPPKAWSQPAPSEVADVIGGWDEL
jgi:DNA repair protein RadD